MGLDHGLVLLELFLHLAVQRLEFTDSLLIDIRAQLPVDEQDHAGQDTGDK